MTTEWLIANIVLVALVAAVVALPAVLIPLRLDRDRRTVIRVARPVRQAYRRRWAVDGQQRDAA